MSTISEILLSSTTHAGDSTVQTVTSNVTKGDGYYGRSDGLHTVQYTYTGFTGSILIQATLVTEPSEEDWFTVHTHATFAETSSKITNFTGNYVWIRAVVNFTDGTVSSIVLNH